MKFVPARRCSLRLALQVFKVESWTLP